MPVGHSMNIKNITSLKNDIVVQTKKLKNKKYREQTKTFLAEGLKNVKDSLEKRVAKMIFVTDEKMLDSLEVKEACPCYVVNEQIMKEISDTVTPQGVAAVFEMKEFSYECISEKILVLNGVSDPGNVGTILRTACALGFNTVIADNKTADIYSPKIIRSSMSAVFALNILRCNDRMESELENLKNRGYKLYVSCLSEKSKNINDIAFSQKCMIVVGNEANGADESVVKLADTLYIIPMEKTIESLNVAIAAGISMYKANY